MKRFLKKLMVAILVLALSVVPSMNSQAGAASTLKFNNVPKPDRLAQGHSFDITGTITSNYNITLFYGEIINADNNKSMYYGECKPNSKKVTIHNTAVNNKLTFGKLPVGHYYLDLTAVDSSGNWIYRSTEFWVEGSVSNLKINMTNYPSGTLTYGKSFNLVGTVSSNYNITKIKAKVIYTDSEAIALPEVVYTPSGTKSVQIQNTVINKNLKFKDLKAGYKYTLVIYAWDASGEPFREKRYSFTVK